MSHVDLHRVRAAFHGALRRVAVTFYKLVNPLRGNFHRDVSSEHGRDGAGSHDGSTGIHRISLRACVLKLDGYFCALRVAGVCDLLQALDAGVAVKAGLSRAAFCIVVYDGRLDGDESELSLRALCVVGNRLIAPCAVCVCKVISHRRNHETVLHSHGSDLDRGEHCLKSHVFFLTLSFLSRFLGFYHLRPCFF